MFECNTVPQGDVNFITQNDIKVPHATSYKLSFKAEGSGPIRTYLYGNAANGKYTDNGIVRTLSNTWQEYTQIITADAMPTAPIFVFRAGGVCSGEVADLELTNM